MRANHFRNRFGERARRMKTLISSILALASAGLFAQMGFASEGVIMRRIQNGMPKVVVPSDVVATVQARFGYAMGAFSAEDRVESVSYAPNENQSYVFRKRNDANKLESCAVSFDQLAAGRFTPSCR